MWSPDLRLLVQQWQDAARADPALAAAFERCAAELTRVVEGEQPSHLVTVGVLDGIAHRVVLVWDPQGHGRYGLWSFPTIPGQGKYVVMPGGQPELAPTHVTAPSLTWRDALRLGAELTSDRQEDAGEDGGPGGAP